MSPKLRVRRHDQTSSVHKAARPVQASAATTHSSPAASVVQRVQQLPGSLTSQDTMQLQRAIGNRAVGRLVAQRREEGVPSSGLVQRQGAVEDEEEVQTKSDPSATQRGNAQVVQRQVPAGKNPASAGLALSEAASQGYSSHHESVGYLPQSLKTGLEYSSGLDLSGVRVHRDSPLPAQLNALAYTQGQDIYLSPGQEEHLPHEGWHVVQQMQGRVKPTLQAKGVPVNDELALEREAEVLGSKALQGTPQPLTSGIQRQSDTSAHTLAPGQAGPAALQRKDKVAQRALPAIIAGMGAAEWLAAGALGYVVAQDAINSASGDISYKFDEMEGVLLPGGGSDIAAYRTSHPGLTIYEATHYLAVWFGTSGSRKMGIKMGIHFLYDGNALGNISLSIMDTYDWPGWAGSVDVNITPRSLSSGSGSVRFTINMGTNNSWFNPEETGNAIFILRANGDLSLSSTTMVWHKIG